MKKFFIKKIPSYSKKILQTQNTNFYFNKTNFLLNKNELVNKLSSIQELPEIDLFINLLDQSKAHKKTQQLFEETAFVGAQHILETTLSLLKGLAKLGTKEKNIYIAGKCYSTSPEVLQTAMEHTKFNLFTDDLPDKPGEYQQICRKVIKQMWSKLESDLDERSDIKRIVILDDGARTLQWMPRHLPFKYKVGMVEQTRGGLNVENIKTILFPLVEVASSAGKRKIEANFIAKALITQVKLTLDKHHINKHDNICGIVGNGAIGSAVSKYLLNKGFTVVAFDESKTAFMPINEKKFYRVDDLKKVIDWSNIIFSCTGKDITKNSEIKKFILNQTSQKKTFASCSSEDREFLELLIDLGKRDDTVYENTLSDIKSQSNTGEDIHILAGGFPINFNRAPGNVPPKDIAYTQGLLLAGCIQAAYLAKKMQGGDKINTGIRYQLDPLAQAMITKIWKNNDKNREEVPKEILKLFEEVEWIKNNSSGEISDCSIFREMYDLSDQFQATLDQNRLENTEQSENQTNDELPSIHAYKF